MRVLPRVIPVFVSFVLFLTIVGSIYGQTGDVRAAIEAANKEFEAAVGRGDGAGLASLYTTAGQLLPTHSDIVSGKQAITDFWQGAIDSGIKAATLATVEVEGQGDTAYEVGKYELKGQEGQVLDSGKYVVIWKRENGKWKLHRDIWNTSMPAPEQ
jgi:uncharacterized protein (TIGR02246 family)